MKNKDNLEIKKNLENLIGEGKLSNRKVFLFGHCRMTEELADLLYEYGYEVKAILDNNDSKVGQSYRGIKIVSPDTMSKENAEDTIVLIAVRFYSSMKKQLLKLGYNGDVVRMIEHDSFSDFSLSDETISQRLKYAYRGKDILSRDTCKRENDRINVICPFTSLGDVFYAMSYLLSYMKTHNIFENRVYVLNEACAVVAQMFSGFNVKVISQSDMEEIIAAVCYYDMDGFIVAHNDKPYFVHLSKALNVKKIPFDKLYCCGVYGLPYDTDPKRPDRYIQYQGKEYIKPGKTLIVSPYASSVPNIDFKIWEAIVDAYKKEGFICYTNTIEGERPVGGSKAISVPLNEMNDVVEKAGVFIGIRSGLCDVIRFANCKKVALFPDYHFKTTRFKAIDVFLLDGWKNVVVNNKDIGINVLKKIEKC